MASVIRVEKTKNFTVMSNYHFKENKMSLKAKGLLSMMLSLPDNWDYSVNGLVTLSSDGETSVRSGLRELEEFGYLIRNRLYENGKISGIEYIIYEEPQFKNEGEKLKLENLIQGNHILENQGQLNTKELNTKNNKIKSSKDDSPKNSLIPKLDKKTKKAKDIGTMRSMINAFTQNENIRDKLLEYFNIRVKKGLQPNQWQIILDDLRNFAGDSASIAVDKINGAIAGGYMQIIAPWEKDRKNNFNKPKFDNTAGREVKAVVNMTEDEKKEFEDNLATDEDGNLLEF